MQEINSGVWTALVTPFNDRDEIDWPSFEKLVANQVAAKVAGLVICGTTGEASSLAENEKIKLWKKTKELLPNGMQVMAGVGTMSTRTTLDQAKIALECGADSLLVVPPPYVKANRTGLQGHFEEVAKLGSPLCLYYVPGRTAQGIPAEVVAEICQIPGVNSVKEASADLTYTSRLISCLGGNKKVFSGDDPTFLAALAVGGKGCISVTSNAFPKTMVDIYDSFSKGENDRARHVFQTAFGLIESLFVETNPCPVKYVLSELGYCQERLRLPLGALMSASKDKIRTQLSKTRPLLAELNLD